MRYKSPPTFKQLNTHPSVVTSTDYNNRFVKSTVISLIPLCNLFFLKLKLETFLCSLMANLLTVDSSADKKHNMDKRKGANKMIYLSTTSNPDLCVVYTIIIA